MTEKKYIVALDQGTTSSRAVVMDHDANIISVSQREFEQIYPKPGWVEHDPMVLRTSVKPLLSGKKKPASLSITPLSGSAVVPQKSASI